MGEQRRRGRGRSGRGGRIPRKGEATPVAGAEESFVSFPLDVSGPIRVPSALDEAAIATALGRALELERELVRALEVLARETGDALLGEIRRETEGHRSALEQLARELGVDTRQVGGGQAPSGGGWPELVAGQQRARLGWWLLQRAAWASGDRRIEQVVRPVLHEKERHAVLLEMEALRQATTGLFRAPEE